MGRVTVRRKTTRIAGEHRSERVDTLAVEEPLELRVGGESLQVTMRTPGDDFELATGFLLAEGVITKPRDIVSMRYCAGVDANGEQTYNLLDIVLAADVAAPPKSAKRNTTVTSACGVCGKDSLEDVRTKAAWSVAEDDTAISAEVLASLPDRLRKAQKIFDRTGGLHAAGLFTADGTSSPPKRTWAATTRSTRSSAKRSGGPRPVARHRAGGVRARLLRTRPEGRHGRDPRPGSGLGPFVARGGPRRGVRPDPRGLRAGGHRATSTPAPIASPDPPVIDARCP